MHTFRKCSQWPETDVKQLTVKRNLYILITCPCGPNVSPFCYTTTVFENTRLSEMHRITWKWPSALKCQKYPVCFKFHFVSLYCGSFFERTASFVFLYDNGERVKSGKNPQKSKTKKFNKYSKLLLWGPLQIKCKRSLEKLKAIWGGISFWNFAHTRSYMYVNETGKVTPKNWKVIIPKIPNCTFLRTIEKKIQKKFGKTEKLFKGRCSVMKCLLR